MGEHKPTSLTGLAHYHGGTVTLACQCGHAATEHAGALAERFREKRLDDHFSTVRAKLRCSKCGRKGGMRIGYNMDGFSSQPRPMNRKGD